MAAPTGAIYSYLELVEACDNFPYYADLESELAAGYIPLYLPGDPRRHGCMTQAGARDMPWTADFQVSPDAVRLVCDPTAAACTAAFKAVVDEAIERKLFMSVLNATHSELFPILGATMNGGRVEVERFAGDLFGIVARGAHLTVYTNTAGEGMKIWVPRRSPESFTFPNRLDTTVAGGVPAHQTPFENIVQEADEEASLPAELIEQGVKATGLLSYIGRSDQGFVAPDLVYVFDLEVGADVVPTPKDGEVEEFYIMSVDEVKTALKYGEFKTNSAVVMIDFLYRHRCLAVEECGGEVEFQQLCRRMKRYMPFPAAEGERARWLKDH